MSSSESTEAQGDSQMGGLGGRGFATSGFSGVLFLDLDLDVFFPGLAIMLNDRTRLYLLFCVILAVWYHGCWWIYRCRKR
jgi:hypothetical protein